MKKTLPKDQALALFDRILAVDVDSIEPVSQERLWRHEFAKQLRPFFKSLGFSNREISATVPNYSGAHVVYINVPHFEWKDVPEGTYSLDDYDKRRDAEAYLSDLILAAFPSCGIYRRDPFGDYIDFRFIVGA